MLQLIRGGKVITGTDDPPIENGMIMVDDNRILKVFKEGEVEIPVSCVVHDVGEEVILPGLVDAHSHCAPTPGQGAKRDDPHWKLLLSATLNIRSDLKNAITTIRSLGDIDFIDVYLREAVESELVLGPRMSISTRGIKRKVQPHLWSIAIEANGSQAIRKAIRENVKAGADWIKIFVTGNIHDGTGKVCYFSKKEIQAAVEESHKLGKPVSAHALGGEGLKNCLEAGVDTIEHGAFLSDDEIELLIKKGIWLVPTFNPLFREAILEDIIDEEMYRRVERGREIWINSFLKAYKAGVKCAMGTDGRHGWLNYEMECWCRFGISETDAIIAATRDSAKACAMGDKVGTLEPGKFADLVSVKGDPLKDITALRNIGIVMKNGKRYDSISLK
jgi:imidazolonepropionase-like amidohydrolase